MRENFVQPLGMSFQANQEMQGRGSEKQIHHEAISHGNAKSSHATLVIQECNTSNGVQFGAETKKLWPFEGNCAKLKRNFALTFPDAKIFALTFPDAKIFTPTFPNAKIFAAHFPTAKIFALTFSDAKFFASPFSNAKIQATSEDVFSEDEWLDFWSLGRNGASEGRLVKIKNPHETELELEVEVMEAIPEDQHSQHAPTENLNAYRSMRDHMYPPCMSAPSCIVPPTEQLVIRPHIVPLLPIFHGMDRQGQSLRPRSIQSWTDLQAEFLKKFFPTHRTNDLKRQISNFSTKENEKFYECWERYMEAINACPHYGFDTWLLVSYFMTELIQKQTLQLWQEEDWRNLKSPPQASSLEQAILNLNKVVGDFVADQKSINDQFRQVNAQIMQEMANRNRRMDGKHNDLSQKIDNLQYQISTLTNLNTVQEKGKFPFQPHQNPKAIHEVEAQEGESSQMREVKAMITLRSGKEVDLPTPKPEQEPKQEPEQEPENEAEKEKREENKGKKKESSTKKKDLEAKVNEKPERTINQEEVIKKHMPPPFPQALHGKRGINNA
ncbi:hypothetical protein CK203_063724 [Vitis vinifera]|uniref:Retrotransposon gag domain-containing protein n=1 Tax=Vitis vinifera TaxID=29760 RepID=A0A438GA54_VITVI|nr:hypothetical protein CK203_063724 [Vitis vinifera]